MGKLRAHVLRGKTKSDLMTQLEDLRSELNNLRVAQRNSGSQSKLARIGTVRKSIARVLTVFNQVSREKLKEKYTSQGTGLPKEYREKKTRAIRRKLTKEQATKKTAKGAKKASNFPMRKFAIRS